MKHHKNGKPTLYDIFKKYNSSKAIAKNDIRKY